MTCNLQVMFAKLNDHRHFTRLGRDLQPRPTWLGAVRGRSAPLFPEMRQTPADQLVGTRTRPRHKVTSPDPLPRRSVDHRKLHLMSGLLIHELERWPRVTGGRPLVPDLRHRLDHEN